MKIQFSPFLVLLSILIAIFASYVALYLAHSVTQAKGKAQTIWLSCGAIAMGFGIWSMHFVGMLAFEMPGMEMAYDIPLMAVSVAVAIGASALALYIVSRPNVSSASVVSGGVAMAAGISGMHYIGMHSMRMSARIEWNPYLVLASILIALAASFAALTISIRLRARPDRFLPMISAGVIMGIAIAGMHYTGMLAATFIHDPSLVIRDSNLLVSRGLTVAVLMATVVILGLALAGAVGQRLWNLMTTKNKEVLGHSEEKFRLLIEAVKDYAIFMLDPEGTVTTWNAGAERITGYSDREMIGQPVSKLYRLEEQSAQNIQQELQVALFKGHFEGEKIRLRKDGSQFLANIVITPLFDASGKHTGFSKVIRDVTELKAAEVQLKNLNDELERRVQERTLALQKSESQLRAIAQALPVLVAQFDQQERLLFANEAFCKWFEILEPNPIGKNLKEILADRYEASALLFQKALQGESTTYERQMEIEGKPSFAHVTLVPEFDSENRTKSVIVVASDVTRYKEIEAELKAAKDAAEVANATKSAFLANMSHEIRTPLGAILGFSELMMAEDMTASEKFNSVEIIKRNGKLLSNIINDILDLSKVEAGKMEIETVEVPLIELLSDVASLQNLEATGKGIKLTFTSEGVIPSSIQTDPTRLRQILFNVIGNAIKFTEKGSVDVKVKLLPNGSTTKLAFIVKDTGTGISPEQANKLFSPFTQADASTTRRFGGTGLGLVLSRKLAQALGGDLILQESSLGKGSNFVITIEPGQAHEIIFESHQEDTTNVVSLPVLEKMPQFPNLKVLVVDDSYDNQRLIKKLLTLAGATVETANNGREGIERALKGNFTVVLMDLQMPEMDGYEATRELRARGYDRPIIALTAHAMKEEKRKVLEGGFNRHLTKPVDRDVLIQTLSDFSA